MQRYLSATRYLTTNDAKLKKIVENITKDDKTEVEKAVTIYHHVKETVKFGWCTQFYAMNAREIYASGYGYCNTKATLFNTMLRIAGIPARQHFYLINADILAPFASPSKWVEHSTTEVFLNDKWLEVDSYVSDTKLYNKAMKSLKDENKVLGWGAHIDSADDWDGTTDSFQQLVRGDKVKIFSKDFGVFNDTEEFYKTADPKFLPTKRTWFLSAIFYVVLPMANNNVIRYRDGK